MTLTRALPANGLSALQAGELVSGIKTGLHRTELLTRALGREGGGYSLLFHLPFPHISKAGTDAPLPRWELGGLWACTLCTNDMCVQRSWPWGSSHPCLLVSVRTQGKETQVQKKYFFNKTLVSKTLDSDSLPEQKWTSSTLLLQGHMRITALSWHSGMRKGKNTQCL